MASIRTNILEALVARFAAVSGWVAVLRGPSDDLNAGPRQVYVYDEGEQGTTDAHIRYAMVMDIRAVIRVRVEDATNAYTELDDALVELQQVLHASPELTTTVAGLTRLYQVGHQKGDPDETNTIAARWSLKAHYIHDYQDPTVWTATP